MGTDTDNASLGRYVGGSYGSFFGSRLFFQWNMKHGLQLLSILVFLRV